MENKINNSLLKEYKNLENNISDYISDKKEINEKLKIEKKKFKEVIKQITKLDISENTNPSLYKIKKYYLDRKTNILTEVFNAITHGIGVIWGVVALILLLLKSNNKFEMIPYLIYGVSFILLFLASTLYHSLSFTKSKKVFRIIDHSSIFLLIAGTYTPYLLISLYSHGGLYYFIGIWTIALIGILLNILTFDKTLKISVILYVAMGWLSVVMIYDLVKIIDIMGIVYLALGGLTYTGGIYFYKKKSMKYSHVIWHLFVLGGATLMFLSIYLYV